MLCKGASKDQLNLNNEDTLNYNPAPKSKSLALDPNPSCAGQDLTCIPRRDGGIDHPEPLLIEP